MRKIYFLLIAFALAFTAKAQVTHLVISQVYGGGGNASATYNRDFVEIFNPTGSPVDLTNWSVQYQSAGGTTWNVNVIPSGTIAPGGYFLIQLAGGATGAALPTPDATPVNQTNLSGTAGKIALVNIATAITSCTDVAIVDKIGYGTTSVVCNETANSAAPANNASSLLRANNGCTDADNNSTDFSSGGANPRNTASPTNNCAANSITTGAVATTPFCVNATTTAPGTVAFNASGTYNTTFTAFLSDAFGSFASPVNIGSTAVNGTNPSGSINVTIPAGTVSGTGYKIRVDATSPAVTGSASAAFEIINGAKNVSNATAAPGSMVAVVSWTNPNACFDEIMIVAKAGASITATPTGDGTAYTASNAYGSGTAFDGGFVVYKGIMSPQTITNLTNGTTYFFKIFTRKGTNWSTGVEVSTTPNVQPAPGEIVINQFSPDYATANDEYIELVNKTNNTFDLSGLAIRYQSSTGSAGSAGGALSGTLQAKRFWLLSPNATITVGMTNNLPRDGAISPGFAAANGQFALVRISDNVIIDAVGYGTLTGGTYTETATAPNPPVDGGLRRVTNGVDTDNNSVDFTTVDNANIRLTNSSGTPLPVKFTNVRATQKAYGVEIAWTNATEENVVDYTIERSANGRNFSKVDKIAARFNNSGKADYSFIDASPLSGDNFYRIKAVETSGKNIYTNIVRINTAKKGIELVVYPNPVSSTELGIQLSNLPAGNYTVRVININGQIVGTRNFSHSGGSMTESVELNNLINGVYTLEINGAVKLQKQFLKQ